MSIVFFSAFLREGAQVLLSKLGFMQRHAACPWRSALGFSLLSERLLCFLAVGENAMTPEGFSEIARTLSEKLEYSEENTERLKLLFL